MRIIITLFFVLLPVLAHSQTLALHGRVVDAETGAPLPYAAIYLEKGRGAMTNADGDFSLSVSQGDVLTFSFIGFERQIFVAAEVPKVVKLMPFEQALDEVTVHPVNELDIVRQVIKNLKTDFSRNKRARQSYFLRALLKNDEDSYLIESILSARSSLKVPLE